MHKQPHRAVEKIADNRYWQNQFRVDDAELEAPAEFADYEPPTLPPAEAADADAGDRSGNIPPR
jgi:hypothetical protein